MQKFKVVLFIFVAFCILSVHCSAQVPQDKLPRMPGGRLLMGYDQYGLMLTSEYETVKLPAETDGWVTESSISADGKILAAAHHIPDLPPGSRPKSIVGTYSVADKKWTEYKNIEFWDENISISPDGSKVAYLLRSTPDMRTRLNILDLKNGLVTFGPQITTVYWISISWSPDGNRIVFENDDALGYFFSPINHAIYVLDVQTGVTTRLCIGLSPSWSPSGEWIAFFDYAPNRRHPTHEWIDKDDGHNVDGVNSVSIMHPDGTGFKVLVTTKHHWWDDFGFAISPIWSPDSKFILINNIRDEAGRMDIDLIEIATLKHTRKFKKCPPVYAWIADK